MRNKKIKLLLMVICNFIISIILAFATTVFVSTTAYAEELENTVDRF